MTGRTEDANGITSARFSLGRATGRRTTGSQTSIWISVGTRRPPPFWREVVNFAPQLTRGYNNLGGGLIVPGSQRRGPENVERSVSIEPSRSALTNLGTLYFDDRRFADAAAMFELALEEDDTKYLTWGNLGYAYKFGPQHRKGGRLFSEGRRAGGITYRIRTSGSLGRY